jgi:hypothetical protein
MVAKRPEARSRPTCLRRRQRIFFDRSQWLRLPYANLVTAPFSALDAYRSSSEVARPCRDRDYLPLCRLSTTHSLVAS